jgi:hypothetical protein
MLGGMLEGAVPEGGDTLLHLYRAVQLDALVQEGILYSRWAPDLAYGYGYPLFNYYAPLAYYLVELFHLLGLSLVGAFLAAFIAAFAGAALFTYIWVWRIFGEAAGLVAAALYTFSPYLLIDGFQRGALAELVALALLPLILWSFRLAIIERRWFYDLIAVLAYTALILTHNISALIFTPVLLAYAWMIGASWAPAGRGRWLAGLRLALPVMGLMALSLGLSAFYWLPALAEQDLVRISQAFGPSHFNYVTNFLDPGDLLALPFVVDPQLVQQDVPLAISLIALLLAAFCLVTVGRYRGESGKVGHILFAALVVVAGLFMALPVSVFIWDRLPLLPFVQFPWRFLGLVSLFLAMAAGAGMASLLASERLVQADRGRWLRLSLPALVIGLAALTILPWSYADTVVPPPATIAGAAEFARQSGAVGTTSAGEYFPVSVSQVPAAVRPGFPEDEARLDLETLPEGARLLAARYRPLAYKVTLDSPVPLKIQFNTFFFEGWRGTVDGQPVDLRAAGPSGLIGLEAPAGRHDITVSFESTAVRGLAAAVSWISLLLLAPALFFIDRGQQPARAGAPPAGPKAVILAVIATLLMVLFLRLIYFDRPGSVLLQTRFDGRQVTGVDRTLNADFERQMILLAVDVPERMAADEELALDLYWQTPVAVEQEFSSSVVVVDEQGLVVGQSDKQHPGVLPTTRWETDEYARDRHKLRLLPGTPPGDYQVQVRVYHYGRPGDRLNVLDENGAPVGQELTVVSLAVERPETPADLAEVAADRRVDWPAGEGLVLAAYSMVNGPIQAGEPLFLELFWQATAGITADEQMKIELVDGDGHVVQGIDAPLLEGLPTSAWHPDDLWRAVHVWRLPASMIGGDYEVVLRLDKDRALTLDAITVTAAEHVLAPPDVAFPAGIDFAEVAQLVGYDVTQTAGPGETLPVTLSWLSLGETPVSYKIFVQLLDGEGRRVTGSDAIPAGWERPTTGWIAGEYIADYHELLLPTDLPPGSYQLLVGLYDESSGQRLITAEGQDAYLLPVSIDIRVG